MKWRQERVGPAQRARIAANIWLSVSPGFERGSMWRFSTLGYSSPCEFKTADDAKVACIAYVKEQLKRATQEINKA